MRVDRNLVIGFVVGLSVLFFLVLISIATEDTAGDGGNLFLEPEPTKRATSTPRPSPTATPAADLDLLAGCIAAPALKQMVVTFDVDAMNTIGPEFMRAMTQTGNNWLDLQAQVIAGIMLQMGEDGGENVFLLLPDLAVEFDDYIAKCEELT